MRWRWPFSGSRRATTPISRASCGIPNSERRPHRGAGVAKRERSTPFGMTANRAPARPSAETLRRMLSEGTIRRSIDGVSDARSGRVLRRANARRVDGRHDDGRPGRDGRPRSEHLGPIHVGVDEVDLLAPEPCGELADRELVIGLVEDVDRHSQRAQALDRGARRKREGADLVARTVEAEEQPGVALLGAAVAAGRQQLQDPRPRMAPGPMDPPVARVGRSGDGALVVGYSRPMRPMGVHALDARCGRFDRQSAPVRRTRGACTRSTHRPRSGRLAPGSALSMAAGCTGDTFRDGGRPESRLPWPMRALGETVGRTTHSQWHAPVPESAMVPSTVRKPQS